MLTRLQHEFINMAEPLAHLAPLVEASRNARESEMRKKSKN